MWRKQSAELRVTECGQMKEESKLYLITNLTIENFKKEMMNFVLNCPDDLEKNERKLWKTSTCISYYLLNATLKNWHYFLINSKIPFLVFGKYLNVL